MNTNPSLEEWLAQPNGLSARLRALRTQAGHNGRELAVQLGWSGSKLSRIETAKQIPTAADIDAIVDACCADLAQRESIRAELRRSLDEAVYRRTKFSDRIAGGQVSLQEQYNQLVTESVLVGHFERTFVPGLLQTPGYARRVFTESKEIHDSGVDDIEAAVAARMQRQQMLYDGQRRFEFLMAEGVIRLLLPTADVMRGQLDRLLSLVDGLPNVRIGILPEGRRQLTYSPQDTFSLYRDGEGETAVIVEGYAGEQILRAEEAQPYLKAFDRHWTEAAEGDEARGLIMEALAALPR